MGSQHPTCPHRTPTSDARRVAEGRTMRAVVVNEYGGTPAVAEVPTPQPGPGQVLIKLRAAGMNPMDRTSCQRRLAPHARDLPNGAGRRRGWCRRTRRRRSDSVFRRPDRLRATADSPARIGGDLRRVCGSHRGRPAGRWCRTAWTWWSQRRFRRPGWLGSLWWSCSGRSQARPR